MAQAHESFVSLCRELLELGATQVTCGEYTATFGRPRQVVGEPDAAPVARRAAQQELTLAQKIAQAEKDLESLLDQELPGAQ